MKTVLPILLLFSTIALSCSTPEEAPPTRHELFIKTLPDGTPVNADGIISTQLIEFYPDRPLWNFAADIVSSDGSGNDSILFNGAKTRRSFGGLFILEDHEAPTINPISSINLSICEPSSSPVMLSFPALSFLHFTNYHPEDTISLDKDLVLTYDNPTDSIGKMLPDHIAYEVTDGSSGACNPYSATRVTSTGTLTFSKDAIRTKEINGVAYIRLVRWLAKEYVVNGKTFLRYDKAQQYLRLLVRR